MTALPRYLRESKLPGLWTTCRTPYSIEKTSVMMRNRILMTHRSQARRSPAKFMNALFRIIGNAGRIDNGITIGGLPDQAEQREMREIRGALDGAPEEAQGGKTI